MKNIYKIFIALLVIIAIFSCDKRTTEEEDEQIGDMQGELSLNAQSDSEVLISWQSNSDVEDYYIIERTIGEQEFTVIAQMNPNQTVYRDTALHIGINYRYRLSGVSASQQTNYLENSISLSFNPVYYFFAEEIGIHTVELTWMHDCNYETGYRIERKSSDSENFDVIAETPPDVFSYLDTTAYPNTSITYKVTAFSDYNTSNSLEKYVYLSFPGIIELNVEQINVNEFQLTWLDQVDGEDMFVAERYIYFSDTQTHEIINILENTEMYIDNISVRDQIQSISWHLYAVYDGFQSSADSVNIDIVFPEPFISSIEHVSLSSCKIMWDDNSSGETGFRIDRKIENGEWEENFVSVDANITEWIDEDILLDEEYYYRMRAFSSNNASDLSNTYYYLAEFPAPDQFIYHIETFGEVQLSWSDNCEGEEGYRIDRRLGSDDWEIPFQELPADAESYLDTEITSGTQVSYRVYAFWEEYESDYDQLFNIEVMVDPPENLYYIKDNLHTISLYWTDNITGEEGYRIDRAVDSLWVNDYASVGAGEEYFTDTEAPVNRLLQYRVYAYSGNFNGDEAVTELIDNTIPAPDELYYVMDGISNINLFWEDNVNGEDGFYIDKYSVDGGWQQQYDSVSAGEESWIDTDITYGNTHQYRVYAYYGDENGTFAETDEIVIELSPPENLQYERVMLTTIDLSWSDTVIGEDYYIIDRKVDDDLWITEFDILSSNTESWQDNSLELGTRVTYRVYARDGEYDGISAETDEIVLDFPPPQNFNVTFNSPDQIEFTWDYSTEGIDGFYLEEYDYANGWQIHTDNIPGTSENWSITGDEWGIYRITAYLGTDYTASSLADGIAPEGFAAVPGGSYNMGDSYFEGDEDELPVHEVEISGFYIAETEVNQEDYFELTGSNPSSNQGPELPAENLDWYEAVEYCNALSLQDGYTQCYTISGDDIECDWDADGYRLLTEAEWEYAARGGIHAEDDYRYSGSNDLSLVGWYDQLYSENCATKSANQLGIYDMSGNVWELCWDFYDDGYYESSGVNDPVGPNTGFSRVVRGGGYNSDEDSCRVANRYHRDETYSNGNLGFRICRRK